MKRTFLAGLGIILVLIIALVVYGTYLNQRGESQIAERMSDQTIPLRGAKVEMRQLKQRLALDTLNLYSIEPLPASRGGRFLRSLIA